MTDGTPEFVRSGEMLSRGRSRLLIVDVQDKLLPHIPVAERLIENCGKLMRAAAILNVSTYGTEQYPKGLGETTALLKGLHDDWLEKLAPEKPYDQYRHNGFEDNADAHLKRTIMGREVVVAITEGKLDFGTWERIFYFELDGKRDKRVLIKIIGK